VYEGMLYVEVPGSASSSRDEEKCCWSRSAYDTSRCRVRIQKLPYRSSHDTGHEVRSSANCSHTWRSGFGRRWS